MVASMFSFSISIIALLLLFQDCAQAGKVGFCYGRNGDNLPSPSQVVALLTNQPISMVRIFDNDQSIIQAFANTSIELTISIPNSDLQNFQTEKQADEWVNSFLSPLYPATNITAITVGSEVTKLSPSFIPLVLPAMKNLHTGLTKAGIADKIKVTTTHSMTILQTSFPPSESAFNDSFAASFVKPLLDFLKATGSVFMINVYPFLVYTNVAQNVPLDYALFQANQLVDDSATSLQYASMFDAQIDAIYYAMEAMGHKELSVLVSETGWPTQGDTNEKGADLKNAAAYNNNLVARILNDTGTPHRPAQPIDAFIFSVYDEDRKPGVESERHWGIYTAQGDMKYDLNLQGTGNAAQAAQAQAPQSLNGAAVTWCVAIPGASNDSLSTGIDWACGQGNADCSPIQQGKPCYEPNTFANHASFAYNSYYQRTGGNPGACNFSGTAMITNIDPSYGSCLFTGDSLSPAGSIRGNHASSACRLPIQSTPKGLAIAFFLLAI